ncbi:MAG: GDSL-type esterase/lipase family protein [Prevotella sp.]|nr:GDSL-type esterase/lipase family protein [Prevotella sp.]
MNVTSQTRIKVACVGNSITENYNLPTSQKYPTLLQNNIGGGYEVRNYGISGCTLLKKGNSPYWNQAKYQEVLSWNPDVVIIKLGTNDSKPQNWQYSSEFEQDYNAFIESFENLSSHPKLYLCYPLPAFSGNGIGASDDVIVNEMMPVIIKLAGEKGLEIIDLHTPFTGKEFLTADKIHPNFKGTTLMAYIIGKAICPECAIPELPDDFYIRMSSFDLTDSYKAFTSSASGNLNALTDNSFQTAIHVPFVRNMWFRFEFEDAVKLTGYAITPVKNAAADTPKSWRIQGCNNGLSWEDIDTQSGQQFPDFETKVIETPYTSLDNLNAYKYFRLLAVENNGGENLQLSELQLFGSSAVLKTDLTKNGGTITAEHPGVNSSEIVENLIDGRLDKKYCTAYASGWVQYDSPEKAIIEKYTITSCYNLFERNPKAWTLSGSDDGVQWEVIDSRSAQDLMTKFNTVEYPVTGNTNSYSKFRLNITENNSGSSIQFAEWQLFAKEQSDVRSFQDAKNRAFVSDGYIRIETEEPIAYEIYRADGNRIDNSSIAGGCKTIKANCRGIYVLKILSETNSRIVKLIY